MDTAPPPSPSTGGLRQDLRDALLVMHARGEPQVFSAADFTPAGDDSLSFGDAPPPLSHGGREPGLSPQVVFATDVDVAPAPAPAPGPSTDGNADADADTDASAAPDPNRGPDRADVLFTEAMRADMAREAVGAPEDVAAPLAASVIEECKWQHQVLTAQLEQYVATENQRHAASQQLMGRLVESLAQALDRHRGQAKDLWKRLQTALRHRLQQANLHALAHQVTTVTSEVTAATLLDQVATQAAGLMATWPALAALHYCLQRVQALGTALREARVEASALGQVHTLRLQQAENEAHGHAKATVDACKRRLQRLSQTHVPAEGTKDLLPAGASASALASADPTGDRATTALGGRQSAAQTRAQALAAASTAATLVKQKEAARLALQTRIAYELHLLEKNVSGT